MVPRQYKFMKIFEYWRDMRVVWKWAVLQDFKIRCYFAILPRAHFPSYNLVLGMVLTVRSYQNFLEENVKSKWKTDVLRNRYGASASFFYVQGSWHSPYARGTRLRQRRVLFGGVVHRSRETRLAPFSISRVFPRNMDLLEKDNYIFLT